MAAALRLRDVAFPELFRQNAAFLSCKKGVTDKDSISQASN
jgi:hypothetical protein